MSVEEVEESFDFNESGTDGQETERAKTIPDAKNVEKDSKTVLSSTSELPTVEYTTFNDSDDVVRVAAEEEIKSSAGGAEERRVDVKEKPPTLLPSYTVFNNGDLEEEEYGESELGNKQSVDTYCT